MFGLAAAAACMPCHEDWLNDLSLMPPVSVTMHPVNLVAVPEPEPEPVVDELGFAHPAATKATAANPAAARKACLTCYLLFQSACRPLRPDGFTLPRAYCWPLLRPERPWVEDPGRLLRDDRRLDLVSRPGKVEGDVLPRRCQIATGGTPMTAGRIPGCGLSCPVPPLGRLLS